ncbi:hypothetical protein BU23DRAFT_663343 [Bimuria novae-zelandiae CBS 107.79]|uniref:Uncharacterized protein n=1 Tax=Bimuria novae-zelandiae CBS 107.79 TaxID=1447943 RepID=A0A6A5UPH0_9PLEO|nr:hypothetical protein BU23DRAFT_663343 [Bimuria novae-zelandiae CBS 107.79]
MPPGRIWERSNGLTASDGLLMGQFLGLVLLIRYKRFFRLDQFTPWKRMIARTGVCSLTGYQGADIAFEYIRTSSASFHAEDAEYTTLVTRLLAYQSLASNVDFMNSLSPTLRLYNTMVVSKIYFNYQPFLSPLSRYWAAQGLSRDIHYTLRQPQPGWVPRVDWTFSVGSVSRPPTSTIDIILQEAQYIAYEALQAHKRLDDDDEFAAAFPSDTTNLPVSAETSKSHNPDNKLRVFAFRFDFLVRLLRRILEDIELAKLDSKSKFDTVAFVASLDANMKKDGTYDPRASADWCRAFLQC